MNDLEFEKKIAQIIEIEWPMFHAVNGDADKADCQNDRQTFTAMRRAQFSVWPWAGLASYLEDLQAAVADGRNLLEEKYVHMMEYTAPESYAALSKRCPKPSDKARELVEKITSQLIRETEELFSDYPLVAGQSRPLYASEDHKGVISVETYNRGELLTYSEQTLTVLSEWIRELAKGGKSYSYQALENSARCYGHVSLAEAEAKMEELLDSVPQKPAAEWR